MYFDEKIFGDFFDLAVQEHMERESNQSFDSKTGKMIAKCSDPLVDYD